MRLNRTSRVNLFIPVTFINQETSVGLKAGGTLVTVRSEVELKVTAGNIPETIEIDLANVEIGDSVNISNVTLPEGSRPMITDRDFVIANIAAPSSLKSEGDDEEEGGEDATPAAEGEATEE